MPIQDFTTIIFDVETTGTLKDYDQIIELPKRSKIMFPIFDQFNYTGSSRTVEQRRGDKAGRLFEKLVKDTDLERLDGYHALRHSFISILVAQGKTWDQIAAFVGHLDQKTTQRYIHLIPKDKRETANSIPFEF